MTAKEQQRMARLEAENDMLRERNGQHLRIYGDMLIEMIELKATLSLVGSAINGDGE
ncbi:hypothetical protein [Propionivibrio sp.]|uniref:hypothetical protein n=1 Tax=Propionivibrio sp. TaxID=2212460 RepID=UPI003BF04BF7